MKKILLSLVVAAAALFATSCANELEEGIQGNGNGVTFEISAPELATRAYGEGTQATHLMYAVYDETANGEVVRGVSNIEIGTEAEFTTDANGVHKFTTSVQIDLLDGNLYSVLFWAVNENYNDDATRAFTINWDEKAMEMKAEVAGNNDAFDAFYGYVPTFKVEGAVTKSVTLTRPFAQLNYGSTDFGAAADLNFVPAQSSVIVKNAPTKLNCVNGEVSGEANITYRAAAVPDGQLNGLTADYLAMNYVLVNGKRVFDTTLSVTGSGKTITNDYASVPMQRNYRTNVYGALLTNKSDFGVEIKPGFGGADENMEIVKYQAGSAQDLQNAIDNAEEGKTNVIELTGDIDLNDLNNLFGPAPVATRAESSKGVVIPAERTITLDLKGFTLKYTGDVMGEAMITNKGKLFVTNGTVSYNYTGAADTSYGKGNYTILNQGGELVVNDAKIYNISEVAAHAMFAISNHAGDVVVNGGEVVTTKGQGIRLAPFSDATTTVTVNAGLIKAPRAIQVHLPGGNVKKATLNVNGGVLESTDNEYKLAIYGLATNDNAENTTINIAGGEFKGVVALNAAYTETAKANSVVVTGGTFKNEDGVYSYSEDYAKAVAVISISGGLFVSNAPEKYAMDEGYVFEQNADGMYEVVYSGCSINANGEYVILDVAGLKWLAAEVNGGNTFSGKTIKLDADIDLASEEWTPIGNSKNNFQGAFDGQNHTIKNLVVNGVGKSDQGLFGMTTNGEIKNLVVENAKVTGRLNVAVVAGTPYTSKYTNITVKGHVEVNGMAYVGGVGGKNAYANWENITVNVDETSYVKANSVENGTAYRTYVGGVVGFNGEGGHSFKNITSNIDVEGSTIDVGGLFGIAHYGNNFENCSCSGNVEVTGAGEAADAEEIGGIAGVWHNEAGQKVTFTNCSFTGTLKANIIEGVDLSDNTIVGAAYSEDGKGVLIIDDVYYVNTADNLIEALESGKNVVLTNNVAVASNQTGSNGYGKTGISQLKGGTIDGNGYDISVNAWGTWDSAINTTGGTIKNINVTGGMRGIFVNHNSTNCSKVILENVTIDGTVYTISCDQGTNNGLEATNSTFNGWTSYAATIGDVKFVNCTFGEGQGYAFCRPYAPTEFVGCEFAAGFELDAVAAVTFENCTLGGVALTAENLATLVTGNFANATVK